MFTKRVIFSSLVLFFLLSIGVIGVAKSTDNPQKLDNHQWELLSPSRNIKFSLTLSDGKLSYQVSLINSKKSITAISSSPMGLVRKDQNFTEKLFFLEKKEQLVDEKYSMLIGKQSLIQNHANETVYLFKNSQGNNMEIWVRAYDDGVAFRYRFPEKTNEIYEIVKENTGFKIPLKGKAWLLPYDKPSLYTPAYEHNYEPAIDIGTPAPIGTEWCFPLLFNTNNIWVLVTEAGLDGTYCGTHIGQIAVNGLYKIAYPNLGEGQGVGAMNPQSTLPWATPWRAIVIGATPANIVETNMVYNLSEPSKITDISWIRPGRAAWSWWSDHDSSRYADRQTGFIDLAKEFTWEYYLVDANWNIMNQGSIDDLINYAKKKGIGLILWYNSGGEHNKVTEQPRDIMADPQKRRAEMHKLAMWGVKGIKVDFFQSDKQAIIQLYQDILKDAADYHLVVDFHGCTIPRGWSRTWPNLLTMEGVKGAEYYGWDFFFSEEACWQNSIYVFARNTIGPMDYTPVTFTNYQQTPHTTTFAHETALAVVFESGLLHFADKPSAYHSIPDFVQDFFKKIPVTWDETKYIDGFPGKYVVIARRKGNDWYVGGINGEKKELELTLKLPFLGKGKYQADLITDGESARTFGHKQLNIEFPGFLKVKLLAKGGFAGVISKQ